MDTIQCSGTLCHKPANHGRLMDTFRLVAQLFMTVFGSSITNLPTLAGQGHFSDRSHQTVFFPVNL